jgi:hypothetical protein
MSGQFFIVIFSIERFLVQAFFEDYPDSIITEVAIVHCPVAGMVQSLTAGTGNKTKDALACFIGLFGMLPYLKNTGNIIPCIASNKRSPLNELLRCPIAFKLVPGC